MLNNFYFRPSPKNCSSRKNPKLKYFHGGEKKLFSAHPWCDDVRWLVVCLVFFFASSSVMCCIHLFTWHTQWIPSTSSWAAPTTSKFISPCEGGNRRMCNKSCCENCQKNSPGDGKIVINTENLCFSLQFFLLGCQEEYHAYDMACCVHFAGFPADESKVSRAL